MLVRTVEHVIPPAEEATVTTITHPTRRMTPRTLLAVAVALAAAAAIYLVVALSASSPAATRSPSAPVDAAEAVDAKARIVLPEDDGHCFKPNANCGNGSSGRPSSGGPFR